MKPNCNERDPIIEEKKTDPNDPCDLIAENQTETPTAEWNDLDCDNDGLTNGEETSKNNNPNTPINPNGNITDPSNPYTGGVTVGNEADNETNPTFNILESGFLKKKSYDLTYSYKIASLQN